MKLTFAAQLDRASDFGSEGLRVRIPAGALEIQGSIYSEIPLTDYLCPMPRALLIPFVICGLLLIPSCSSSDANACESAQQIVEDDVNKVQELLLSSKDLDKNGYGLQANEVRGEILRTSEKINRLIVKNQSCFTAEQVAEAQSYIASIE